MTDMSAARRAKVAVVGSGMAGLVTAWLLKQDPLHRYDVEIFENGFEPSLDSASVSVANRQTGEVERIDVPMRAFTEGYYHNLKAMYDFLGVRYHVQPFLFSFSRLSVRDQKTGGQHDERQYFVHASNNHRLPPVRPSSTSLLSHLGELLFVTICYLWFSVCCLIIPTRLDTDRGLCESFEEYLQRIRMPKHFIQYYLLPLISAVTTCPHKDLLRFPAKDVVEYKRCITSGRQLTVSAGVHEVQNRLVKGIKVQCSAQVVALAPSTGGVRVRWRDLGNTDKCPYQERLFDKVVLAVPPNVVGSVFEPLRKQMQQFPTIPVETIVHHDTSGTASFDNSIAEGMRKSWFASSNADRAHIIHLRTVGGRDARTEATHVQPSGMMVTSCPLTSRSASRITSSSRFTRVLRTPESQRQVNNIFGHSEPFHGSDEKSLNWKNGDGGVFLVGSWCWDGMVLLEGCVVSAMRTASALGVEIPWKKKLKA